MTILFLLTLLAFCALVWATLAVAHHLRRSEPALRVEVPKKPSASSHSSVSTQRAA